MEIDPALSASLTNFPTLHVGMRQSVRVLQAAHEKKKFIQVTQVQKFKHKLYLIISDDRLLLTIILEWWTIRYAWQLTYNSWKTMKNVLFRESTVLVTNRLSRKRINYFNLILSNGPINAIIWRLQLASSLTRRNKC